MNVVGCRERQANGKNLRQKEKKLKDLSIQMEDERKQAQQYKDQVTQSRRRRRQHAIERGRLAAHRISVSLRRRRATCG